MPTAGYLFGSKSNISYSTSVLFSNVFREYCFLYLMHPPLHGSPSSCDCGEPLSFFELSERLGLLLLSCPLKLDLAVKLSRWLQVNL